MFRLSAMSNGVEHAGRIVAALGTFVSQIFAARITALVWLKWIEEFPEVAKLGLRLAESGILITLRQFEDIWTEHISKILPVDDPAYGRGKALVEEIDGRKLRDSANRLAAHYAANKTDLPLSSVAFHDLIAANGFATSQEFVTWAGEAMWCIYDVRKGLLVHYSLPPEVDMGTVMSAFLDHFMQEKGPKS
jgi:hypothetical protein